MDKKTKQLSKFLGLMTWSLLRHRFYIPVFIGVQVLLSLAIMYGLRWLTDVKDPLSQSYLSTGALTMSLIAVACVLAPQVVSEAKQNGIYDYQKTLPVSRAGIWFSDLLIWGLLCLPGVLSSLVMSVFGFGMELSFGPIAWLVLVLVLVALLSVGFAIAYVFPVNLVSLMTQLMMLGGLMFSPILFPAERLPSWTVPIYQVLPFVPSSQLIRATFFQLEKVAPYQVLVLAFWAIAGFFLSLTTLTRRK